ncbi:hypothetical protein Ocin01_08777 [Orchesella cincta]|uniref:Uncharacterized protein n=1 Tax=Orchesella cincta TaxID=48709 RepID=A0A1D2MXY3_ORCCI|nr:hypothetical protein Ocin01_08777 [Orchesella cincta]
MLKNLQKQLEDARNAKLEEHSLNEDVKTLHDSQWQQRIMQPKSMENSRLEREVTSRKNALKVREETISSVAHSITAHVLQLPDHYASMRQIREAKNARRSVDKHFVKTIRKARENKAIAITEIQLRQRRQAENLAKLKNEIRDIKQNLITKNNMKRMHDEEIALEKEEVKKLLLSQGANPYIAEYLLAIEEKQREIQRKMLVEEQKRLLDMQREYAIIEAAKAKEEADRKKWNDYWANKVKDKVKQERNSKMELYYDKSPEEDANKGEPEPPPQQERQMSVDKSAPENEQTAQAQEFQEAEEEITEEVVLVAVPDRVSIPERKVLRSEENPRGSRDTKKTAISESSKQSKRFSSERQAMILDYVKKQSLLKSAGINSGDGGIMLMGNIDVFDFGDVPIGERNYVVVNIVNFGVDPIKLKMSILNPYGPFTLCNALKDIPPDYFYTLKFRYQPKDRVEDSETLKIEDAEKPESFVMINLKGQGILYSA